MEAELASLKSQLQRLESTVESSRQIVAAFLERHPGGQRLLDQHVAFLRRSGLLIADPQKRVKRGITSQSATKDGPRRPRTAAATEAAAAIRRAFREANPDAKNARSIGHRLTLFDDGFARGYRDRVENPLARNRFAKGDRSRGWRVGAEAAEADIAAGAVVTAALNFSVPPTPQEARGEFAAMLRAIGVPDPDAGGDDEARHAPNLGATD